MSDERAPESTDREPTNPDADLLPDHAATDDDLPGGDDRVSDDTPLGSEDPANDPSTDDALPDLVAAESPEPIDGIDDVDDLDVDPTGTADDAVTELSADVRALDDGDPASAGAFDDSSSVVESDQTETGVIDDPSDGGDEDARDQAVRDLDDDMDGIESPGR